MKETLKILTGCLILLFSAGAVSARVVRVALVKSDVRAEYEIASDSLEKALAGDGSNTFRIRRFVYSNSSAGFWNAVLDYRPELIITVGTKATRSAMNETRDIPIVFTMVLDRFDEIDANGGSPSGRRVGGVTLSIPVVKQFEYIREAMPFVRRVGLIYSPNSVRMYNSARDRAKNMNLQLITREILSERDIQNALREILPDIDVFWMPPDAIIYSDPNILRSILRECYVNSVPIVAVSRHLAVAGAPLALGTDYEDIGRQTADLILGEFADGSFSSVRTEPPRKIVFYINKRVISSLGLSVPGRVLESAIPVESER